MERLKVTYKSFLVLTVLATLIFCISACTKKDNTSKKSDNSPKAEESWSSSLDRGNIPDTPIAGKINDKTLPIAYVKVKKWFENYSFAFSTIKPESPCSVVMGDDAVEFSSKVLKEGTFSKKMDEPVKFDDYHAYYYYKQADGSPMSINTEWSATVVVSKIDKDAKKVKGWAKFDFGDGKTAIEGTFDADLCE